MHKRSAVRAALRGKRVAIAVAAAFVPLGEAYSLPTGEQVVHGQVNVTRPDAVTMQINQGTQKGIVNWTGFSIHGNEHVNITQPNSAASLLNRVVGNDPSNIFGRLTANGQVFLVNNAGVFFAPGASVNAAALVASTLSITDQNFLDNTYQFFNPGNAGSVVNQGSIVTAGGFTALIGPQVRNDGIILANSGKIALGAGNRVSLDMIGDGLVSISVDEAAFNASVINTGTLQADGGTVMLKASSANALLDTVINTSGIVRANSLIAVNGEIILDGGGAGTVAVTGTVEGTSATVSGAAITVSDGGSISTSLGTGSQTISTPGTLSVLGGTAGNTAISHAGAGQQQVTAGNIVVRGGSAVGGTSATIGSSNAAADQTISVAAGRIEVTGGTFGGGNRAAISSAGNQTIAGNADITLTGGASGDLNIAAIHAGVAKTQTIHARNISLTSGTGGTNNAAVVLGQTQFITTTEDVQLTGSTGGGNLAGARIGGLSAATAGVNTPTDLTLNVGRDLVLTGGLGPSSPAVIGSTAGQAQTMRITTGRDVVLQSALGAAARIGTSPSVPGNVSITAGRDVLLRGGGEINVGVLNLQAAGALNLDATSPTAGNALIQSNGGQTITAQSVNLTAQNGRTVQILNTGAAGQSITAGNIDIQTAGGGGVAEIRNNSASSQSLTVTGERLTARGLGGGTAAVFSGGDQTISMAGAGPQQISLGDHAAQGRAFISAIGNQAIQGNADLVLIGGSGPIADGSNAIISVLNPLSVQGIHARTITLANSMLGGNNSVAAIQGANQVITTTGDVTLTGNASGGNLAGVRIGGVGGAGATATNVTLNVGGDLVLTGGSVAGNGVGIGSTAALGAPPFENIVIINTQGSVILNSGVAGSGARIGSPQTGATPGSININAVGDIQLNGVDESATIRTTGTVNLNAASITEGPRGAVIAGTLLTNTAGATLLTGENQVSNFSATSGGALALNNSGALVTGGISASNVVLTNQGNVTVTAPVISASTMDVSVAGHLAVNGSGAVDALLRSSGGQTITAHSLSLTAQDGRRANIENVGGNQTVSATAGDMNLQVPAGFGVAQIINTAPGGNQTIAVSGRLNVQGGVISPATSRNSGIFKNGTGGLQSVSAAGITLQGANSGTQAGALISSQGDQLVDVTGGNINLIGGAGGITNNASISTLQATPTSPIGKQTIRAHHITLTNSSGGTDTVAGIFGSDQTINATGNVTLTSGGASVGGAAGGPGVRIGAPGGTTTGTKLNLTVGGNLVLNGGTAIENGASIGSSGAGAPQQNNILIDAGGSVILNAGTEPNTGVRIGSGSSGTAGGNITILADGSIELNGAQRSAAIRTLDSVTLEAASISEGTNGFILADTLTTTTSGVTNLGGPNEIARFNGTSGGALTLVDGGALQVTGITTTNDAITLTTDNLTNTGTITNTGGAPGVANVILNADAFNLAGGTIDAGAAAVALRPRTGTNSLGIEAAGQTTLTNADIASIHTSDFVLFGSGTGTTFTGNMTIGENAQVQGGGKHLAFFRSPTAGGTITIGSQGVATTGDVIISAGIAAGSGAILSNGGTVAGDEVQLRAGQGIGAPGARVNTAANALGISNLGGAGVFVSEADAVTLRPISLNVGGMINNVGSNTAGTFDFTAGGDLTVNGFVSSNAMNVNVAGALNIVASGGLDAVLLSSGGQTITAQSVTLSAQDNRRAGIQNNTSGNQSVTSTAGGMNLQGNGGAGVAQIINNATTDGNQTISVAGQLTVLGGATSTGSTNSGIFKNGAGGLQTVSASGITLQGASSGANAGALIASRGEQLVDVTGGNINLIGGSGGITNNASISTLQLTPASPVRKQTIRAHHISLTNSSGGTDTVAGIFGSDQTITATGNVTLTAGGAFGAGPAVRIGAPGGTTTGTKLNMTVGGNLVLNGGTVAENAAAIGSSGQGVPQQNNIFIDAGDSVILNAGTASGTGVRIGSGSNGTAGGNITIEAGGNIELNGTERSAAIRTLDTVTLHAANISEVGLGTIIAGTLNTHSSGSTLLTGMDAAFNINNAVSNFNGVSGGDLTFFNRGPLTVTGLNATGNASLVNALADLNLAGQWTSSTASIFAGAAVVESGAGAIQAASLTAEALRLNLAGANRVGVLDAKTADVLTFNNVAPLEVARVSASNGASLTSAGTMTISGPIISSSGINLTANGGSIVETGAGSITTGFGGLTTFSTGDTTLNGSANQISSFNATSGGDVSLVNNGFVNVSGMNAAGDVAITAFGNTTVSGPWTAGGTSAITAGNIVLSGTLTSADVVLDAGFGLIGLGSITETVGGAVIANTLSTTAGGTTSLGGPNVVSNFNGTSGADLTLNNSRALNVTGLSAGGPAAVTNSGNVTISGGWNSSSASITANGFGATISEAGGGFIQTGSLTTFSDGATSLTGANQVQSFNGSTGFGGEIRLNNTGALNVTGLGAGGNVTLTNAGDVNVSGPWSSFGATSVTTTGAGSDLFVNDLVTSSGAMNLNIAGDIAVTADIGRSAMLTSFGGQTINARSLAVTSNGGFAQVRNSGLNAQTIKLSDGAGLDVQTLAPGGFASVSAEGGGSQTINVVNGDHINVRGANGVASISNFGGNQVLSITGSGANAITLGASGALGPSQVFGGVQNITAGAGGEAGSITIIGGDGNVTFTGISSGQILGGTQTVSTSGNLRIVGGNAANQPPNGFATGLFHNGSGEQRVSAASLEMQGGASGVNNTAIIISSGGAQTITPGNQVIDVGGSIRLTGGASGVSNTAIIVSFADQNVSAGSLDLVGGTGGSANGAFINIAGPAISSGNQFVNVAGDLSVAGGAGGSAGLTGSANLQQTIFADNITLTNSAGGGINSVGFILGGHQDIHAAGSVTLTARASGGDLPGVRIGGLAGAAPTATDLTLNVGGDLILSGGTTVNNGVGIGSTAATGVPPLENNITINAGGSVILNAGTLAGTGARIGSPATATGPGSISVTAGGGIELNGETQGTAIRTLGTVSLVADHITEGANGFIVAGTLNTTTQGHQVLTGPNRVAAFTASSDTGNVSLTNTAPVLTLGSMELPGSLSIVQAGTLSIPGTVSALSHAIDATGDVLVGSASATSAALLYASGDISITTPGSVIVRGSDVTPLAASAVLADGNLQVAAGNVTIQGGGALLTPAAMRGEAVDISAASELRVKGGSGHLSPALLSSGRNVNLTIGDAVRVDAGSGLLSFARIQTEIKNGVIHISFPDLSQGGYFVNGVEGRTHQGETGFFTLNKPAKLGKTLLVDYGGAD